MSHQHPSDRGSEPISTRSRVLRSSLVCAKWHYGEVSPGPSNTSRLYPMLKSEKICSICMSKGACCASIEEQSGTGLCYWDENWTDADMEGSCTAPLFSRILRSASTKSAWLQSRSQQVSNHNWKQEASTDHEASPNNEGVSSADLLPCRLSSLPSRAAFLPPKHSYT